MLAAEEGADGSVLVGGEGLELSRLADTPSEDRVIGVMATSELRSWTAQIVISSEHAGLRPYFKELEAEIRHVLARVDAPRDVLAYLRWLRVESGRWRAINENLLSSK